MKPGLYNNETVLETDLLFIIIIVIYDGNIGQENPFT